MIYPIAGVPTERDKIIWLQDQIFLLAGAEHPWAADRAHQIGDLINALESITFARRQKNGCVVAPTRVRT